MIDDILVCSRLELPIQNNYDDHIFCRSNRIIVSSDPLNKLELNTENVANKDIKKVIVNLYI